VNPVIADDVRTMIYEECAADLAALGLDATTLGEDCDLRTAGIIDSLGFIELVAALEGRLDVEIDLEALPPEDLTRVSALSRYVAGQAATRGDRLMRSEPLLGGDAKRIPRLLALYGPVAETLRVRLHRLRGVQIGEGDFVSSDELLETSHAEMVSIGDRVDVGARTTIIAHQQGEAQRDGVSIRIEDDAFVGPGSLLLPHVTIGRGAVVSAGSVVSRSVPPLKMVRGNPAAAVARCGLPLGRHTPLAGFYRQLRAFR
jgi:acetyltransferase-like isoleucine patch superfamily enzyme